MVGRRVIHLLRWFEQDGEALAGEEPLTRVAPAALRRLFERPAEDLLLGVYPVGPSEAAALQPEISHRIDRDRFVYYVEPAQLEA